MADQADVYALLRTLSGAEPTETQISAVFVGADTVFKLKRAVQLSFLDFRTLAARRHFLGREVALNGTAAPGLYRDVVPITRTSDGLALDGEGDAVDYVLRMAPIAPEDFLLARVAQGLPDALLDALGDMVADDHARRAPAPSHDPGHPGRNARGNAAAAVAAGLPADQVAAWLAQAEHALDGCAGLLAARAAAGLMRRAHGDLHLGNICLWQGRPVPFDALEFDEAMATIDLAYDLAFLLMDLDRRAGRAAANRVLNRYVARTGDAALVRLLPGFLSRRAMVRAHVTGDAGLPGRGAGVPAAGTGPGGRHRRAARHRQVHPRPCPGPSPGRRPRRTGPAQRRDAQAPPWRAAGAAAGATGLC